jgi:hypothetical protein
MSWTWTDRRRGGGGKVCTAVACGRWYAGGEWYMCGIECDGGDVGDRVGMGIGMADERGDMEWVAVG